MIYIYRILWLIFYVPLFIVALVSFIMNIILFFVVVLVYFIKEGDVEKAPDWCIPGKLAEKVINWYNGLLKYAKNC